MSTTNRTYFPVYDRLQVEIDEKDPNKAIRLGFSTYNSVHNQNHHHQLHHQHVKKAKHHFGAEFDNYRHQHVSKHEWVKHLLRSNESKLKFRRRHEKRWNRQHSRFIDHADQITSKLHADLEMQSIKIIDMINDTENVPMHWPVKKEAIMEGDVILGGLMMVHSREDSMMCGPIMPQGGIQALEAMLYTLDKINEDLGLLPNITIGAHILDDCDRDSYGLEMAVDFIKGMFIFK